MENLCRRHLVTNKKSSNLPLVAICNHVSRTPEENQRCTVPNFIETNNTHFIFIILRGFPHTTYSVLFNFIVYLFSIQGMSVFWDVFPPNTFFNILNTPLPHKPNKYVWMIWLSRFGGKNSLVTRLVLLCHSVPWDLVCLLSCLRNGLIKMFS